MALLKGMGSLLSAYSFKVQDDTKIIRSVREAPPAHYLFEIESFASLKDSISNAPTAYFESTEFEAASYKWVLVIYPNGNEDDDGAYHISLYLKLIDQLGRGDSVVAAIKYYIYDYNRNTYLIIQSLAEQRYNVMEKQKGIARALPLSDFTRSSNGFIKRDRCKFGIEVFVADTIARTAICKTLTEGGNSVYTWSIERFSEITDGEYSDQFAREGHNWKLQIFPRGSGLGHNNSLSLFLFNVDFSDLTNGRKLYVEKEIRIKNLQNGKDAVKISRAWYTKSSHNWGAAQLLSLRDLHNSNKGFKLDDKVIVEVKLNLMMLINDI